MKNFYSCSFLFLLITSCGTKINYLGTSHEPTQKVDVYVDESAITKNYKIVGKGYVTSHSWTKPEQVQTKAIATAKNKGADAVLIKDYLAPAPTGINTVLRSDSVGKTLVTTGHTSVSSGSTSEFMVFFLKYN